MPTYEYLCQACRHRFETWQKMTDEPLTTCPECGSQIRRVLFPSGIVFKGQGFYKTDHNGNGNPTDASSEGDSKKTESSAQDDTKKAESNSKEATKKTESSSDTSTSESQSTTTATTK